MTEPRKYIAPKRVERAFGPDADAYVAVIESVVGDRVRVRLDDGEERDVPLRDGAAFVDALARPDISLLHGRPLLLVNIRYELVALAVGPTEAPTRFTVMAHVVRLGEGDAVEIPSRDDTQPSWLLFELRRGTRDALRQSGDKVRGDASGTR